jgi:hypothetical protein
MKLSKRQQRVWRYMINQLKTHFSPGVPVEVKTVDLKGVQGDCVGVMHLGRMTKVVIRVGRKGSFRLKVDILMHEWAHAMEWEANWTDDSPKREHGETWGVWYSKIYTHLIDDCWEDMKERGLLHREQLMAEEEYD